MPSFKYVIDELDSATDGAIVNTDGSKTLLSSFVPKDENGDDYSFAINSSYSYGFESNLSSGDFNGDGIDDLAFSDYHGDVGFLLSKNGSWEFKYVIENLDSSSSGAIVNTDGSKTLLSSFVPKDENGDDYSFAINSSYSYGFESNLSAGDFNGDGIDDLAFSDYHGDVAFLLSKNGSWEFKYVIENLDSSSSGAIVNTDGSKTLLSSFVPKDENGDDYSFAINSSYSYGFESNLSAGDFNGDGIDDLAFSDYHGDVAFLLSKNGSWEFKYVIENLDSSSSGAIVNTDGSKTLLSSFVPKDENGDDYSFAINSSYSYGFESNLSAGDFNGDGIDDLAFSDYHGDVAFLLSKNGSWEFKYVIENLDSSSSGAIVNTDGSKTLLSSFVPKDENGDDYSFAINSSYSYGLGSNLSAGDFNGDGVDDLAFSDYHGDVAFLLSKNGSWEFKYIIENLDSSSSGAIVNADGSKTLLSSFVPKDENGDDYSFAINSSYSYGLGSNLSAGDFDADGIDDLAFSDYHGDVAYYQSTTTVLPKVNSDPTGRLLIDGIAIEGKTLTVITSSIADADGLGSFSFLWLRGGVEISGATNSSYSLISDDIGAKISVRVSYTDAQGTAESLISSSTSAIRKANSDPVGTPKITGSAKQGEILTVDISNIADSDGLGTFSYTWLRDGSEIAGITSNTHRLAQEDVGSVISVKISYTDGQGYSETITSLSTASITGNSLPTGAVSITGNTEIGSTLTLDAGSIKDQDGLGTFNYQWLRDGSVISAANSTSYTLTKTDAGSEISARVSYIDQAGYSESFTSSGVDINAIPEGYIGIVGSLEDGETLTPTGGLSDADGIGTYSYQWLRDGADIFDATSFTYDLTSDDVGAAISIRVSYTDGKGNAEMFTSSATAPVDVSKNETVVDNTGAIYAVNTGDTTNLSLEFYANANYYYSSISSYDAVITFNPLYADFISASSGDYFGFPNYNDGVLAVSGIALVSIPSWKPLFTLDLSTLPISSDFAITISDVLINNIGQLGTTQTIVEASSFDLTSTLIPSIDENTIVSTPVYVPTATGGSNYSYSISGTDSASFNISSSSGKVYLKTSPNHEDKPSYTFEITVSDGPKFDTETIILSVKDLNEAPNITSTGLTSVNEDTLYKYQIVASDPDHNDVLSFSSVSLPEWLNFNSETGLLFGTPENSDVGAHSVTLNATDAAGSITSQTFSIDVVNVNDAPTGALTISGATKKGSTLTLDSSTVSDEDGLGTFIISWMRDGEVISGANSSSYVPTIDDVDKAITAKVAYTDAHGTAEAMTSSATAAIKDVFIESIGAISVVNSGTGDEPVLDFYLDITKDPNGDGVTSIDVTLSFDPAEASFTSFSYADGLIGAANDSAADGGTIIFGAIALRPVSIDKPLFTMTMKDLNSTEDFGLTVSNLSIDGSALEGSSALIGAPKTFAVSNTVVTRGGSKIADVDVVMNDGTNSSSYKSAADGSVSGALTAGSASTVTASLAYSNSTKAVSSQDALDALRLSVGMDTQNGTNAAFDYIAADFNQDGKVSSQDALAILKYAVGLETAEKADWVFVDTNGDYSGISKSNTSYTEGVSIDDLSADISVSLTGILIGDVNDSYSELIA